MNSPRMGRPGGLYFVFYILHINIRQILGRWYHLYLHKGWSVWPHILKKTDQLWIGGKKYHYHYTINIMETVSLNTQQKQRYQYLAFRDYIWVADYSITPKNYLKKILDLGTLKRPRMGQIYFNSSPWLEKTLNSRAPEWRIFE